MRYFVGFVLALALMALPLSASAQAGEEGTTSEPNLQEPAPSTEPAPEEPALQLKLDSAGIEAVPSPRSASEHTTAEYGIDYTTPTATRIAQAERALERDRRGLIASSVFFGVGLGALAGSFVWAPHADCGDDDPATFDICVPAGPVVVGLFGAAMATGGLIGMAVRGARLAKRKAELRELQEAHYGKPRRVQWDLARSRFVF